MLLGVVVYANSSASDISLMDWPSSSPSSSSIIVTGIDFPMFALYITKAAGLLLSYVCTSSPNHFFLLLIIYNPKKEHSEWTIGTIISMYYNLSIFRL